MCPGRPRSAGRDPGRPTWPGAPSQRASKSKEILEKRGGSCPPLEETLFWLSGPLLGASRCSRAIGTGDELRSDGLMPMMGTARLQRQQGGSEPEVSDGLTK